MNADQLKALRAPFDPAEVDKLPKPYKRDSDKGKCGECGGWHGLPAVHLDYVGHAALTSRLLDVDPGWTWEPVAFDERGLPAFDKLGGLWIKLTVGGVTRLGYGHADGKSGGDAVKEAIGDALRNAAMRFGAALDLWRKHDKRTATGLQTDEQPARQQRQRKRADEQPAEPQPDNTAPRSTVRMATQAQVRDLAIAFGDLGITDRADRLTYCGAQVGRQLESSKQLTAIEAAKVLEVVRKDLEARKDGGAS